MSDQELFIVEILTRLGGASYKRSAPKSKTAAERLAASLEVLGLHANIVPASKYAFKGIKKEVERPDTVRPNQYSSRVE